MAELPLELPSALDLVLPGSIGKFSIADELSRSLEVEYLLTYVSLDSAQGNNAKILNALSPVREVFDLPELEFDEILQRDLDDARISEDLIPYLLDTRTGHMVRFFPPIVVMLLPTDPGGNRPVGKYPHVHTPDMEENGIRFSVKQAGGPGTEVFRFETPITSDNFLVYHDRNRLRLNTSRARLIIVDGQHRAMALLALQRNLSADGWSDMRRAPYKDFYSHWTRELLAGFDLRSVTLPMIICTVPELHEGASEELHLDLKQASRSIFLALNKNARPVSESRNRLLNENDIIAEFLRSLLTEIKHHSALAGPLRIWNVELDQAHDRTRIENKVAITGVNHLYYIVEHLMLRKATHRSLRNRPGNYGRRRSLEHCLPRLNGLNLLGLDTANATSRESYSSPAAAQLATSFMDRYGLRLARILSSVAPLSNLAQEVASDEATIRSSPTPQLYAALFDNQGTSRSLASHVENMKRRIKEGDLVAGSQQGREAVERLSAVVKKQIEVAQAALDRAARASLVGTGVPADSEIINWYQRAVIQGFTTTAFQAALVITFFEALESVDQGERAANRPTLDWDAELTAYVNSVNTLLQPNTFPGLQRLLRVFLGSEMADAAGVLPGEGPSSFRNILILGELQPDAWPKVRFLLLELWQPSSSVLETRVRADRVHLRSEVFSAYYRKRLNDRATQEHVAPEELTTPTRDSVFKESVETVGQLVSALSGEALDEEELRRALPDLDSESAAVELDEEAEGADPT